MEIELTEVERFACEAMVREQSDTLSYQREVERALRLITLECPRVAANLREAACREQAEIQARGVGLVLAVSKARGLEPPKTPPRFEPADGEKAARLVWVETATNPPKTPESECFVADPPKGP